MIDVIKKTLLAGVGAAIITKEKAEVLLKDLVEKGKVSAGEASELATKIADEGRKEFETSSKELTEKVKTLVEKADYARRSEVKALEERVRLLEERLAAEATKVG